MPKFTFKKNKNTGPYASFQREQTDIKLKKKQVGTIDETNGGNWIVRFAIKREPTEENPAPFKWIRVKPTFPSEELARDWIKDNSAQIQQLNLHSFED